MDNEFRLKLYKTFIDNDFDSFLHLFSSLNYRDKKYFFQKPFTHDNQKQILIGHYIDCIILQLHANYNNYSMMDYYNIEDFPHISPLIEHEIISNQLKEDKNILIYFSDKDTETNVKRKRL